MLHHFFSTHGFGERRVHLHADNCVGQNKNRFVMYYLMWRVTAGLHDEATISFLPVGHTKFAPDWCFGLMKQCFRRTKIGDLDDIANCVSLSSAVSVPQLVGSLYGTVFVPTYNWSEFFDNIMMKSALKGISRLHQFRFSAARHGIVYVKRIKLSCWMGDYIISAWWFVATISWWAPSSCYTQWPFSQNPNSTYTKR